MSGESTSCTRNDDGVCELDQLLHQNPTILFECEPCTLHDTGSCDCINRTRVVLGAVSRPFVATSCGGYISSSDTLSECGADPSDDGVDGVGGNELLDSLMYPYTIDFDDVRIPIQLEVMTKAHVIDHKLASAMFEDGDDILICRMDLTKIPVLKIGIHFARCLYSINFNVMTMFAGIPGQMAWDTIKNDAYANWPELLMHNIADKLELRAKVVRVSSISLDQRPMFDRSEQFVASDLFEISPYILWHYNGERVDKISDDPRAFGLDSWAQFPSAVDRFFNLPTPFRTLRVSSALLLEVYNRRTILAGLDRPEVAIQRMTDIIERSPSFSEYINVKLQTGYSVLQDTRILAIAMATEQPWLDPAHF